MPQKRMNVIGIAGLILTMFTGLAGVYAKTQTEIGKIQVRSDATISLIEDLKEDIKELRQYVKQTQHDVAYVRAIADRNARDQ